MNTFHSEKDETLETARTEKMIEILSGIIDSGDRSFDDQYARELVSRFGTGTALFSACMQGNSEGRGLQDNFGQRLTNAFQLAALMEGAPCPIHEPPELDEYDILSTENGTVLVAICPQVPDSLITLSMGAPLTALSPVGGYVARLTREGGGPWWLVLSRSRGSPTLAERMGAVRFLKAAQWIGVSVERFLIRSESSAWEIYMSPDDDGGGCF